ncbi:hypothetical protein ACFQBQ_02210 [Granulicella cerasi]|uniref:Uncharacterized protein n=1 Tax=Granulicella cerasi TaxID=741063 RepID=A0ABW1Z8D4_9BACT
MSKFVKMFKGQLTASAVVQSKTWRSVTARLAADHHRGLAYVAVHIGVDEEEAFDRALQQTARQIVNQLGVAMMVRREIKIPSLIQLAVDTGEDRGGPLLADGGQDHRHRVTALRVEVARIEVWPIVELSGRIENPSPCRLRDELRTRRVVHHQRDGAGRQLQILRQRLLANGLAARCFRLRFHDGNSFATENSSHRRLPARCFSAAVSSTTCNSLPYASLNTKLRPTAH